MSFLISFFSAFSRQLPPPLDIDSGASENTSSAFLPGALPLPPPRGVRLTDVVVAGRGVRLAEEHAGHRARLVLLGLPADPGARGVVGPTVRGPAGDGVLHAGGERRHPSHPSRVAGQSVRPARRAHPDWSGRGRRDIIAAKAKAAPAV